MFLGGQVWELRGMGGDLRYRYLGECWRCRRLLRGGRRSLSGRIRNAPEQSRAHFQRQQYSHARIFVNTIMT